MNKKAHFARLAAAAAQPPLPFSRGRLILLTGQSRLDRSDLSPVQLGFLDAVERPRIEGVRSGFPYDAAGACHAPAHIAPAAIRNARQYLWSRQEPAYAELVAAVIQRLADSVERALITVTGSCGLAMLAAALPKLRLSPLLSFEVVSLGPAGPPLPLVSGVRFTVVQGSDDGWSRRFYRGPVHLRPRCGHLDYWTDPETQAATAAVVQSHSSGNGR